MLGLLSGATEMSKQKTPILLQPSMASRLSDEAYVVGCKTIHF